MKSLLTSLLKVSLFCSAFLLFASGAWAQPRKFQLKQQVIQGSVADYCMDVEGNSSSSGENVQVYPCHNGENQIWDLTAVGGGYFTMAARHSGHCLDVKGASTRPGRNIQQYSCHGGDNQRWELVPNFAGYYWIKNKKSGLCATTVTTSSLWSPKQLRILEQQACSNSDDRLWELVTNFCGNNYCGDFGESCSTCARDCGTCPPICGNLICEPGETCANCSDCYCSTCPNGICDIDEDSTSCPLDCQAVCGDGLCEPTECDTCSSDCPSGGSGGGCAIQ